MDIINKIFRKKTKVRDINSCPTTDIVDTKYKFEIRWLYRDKEVDLIPERTRDTVDYFEYCHILWRQAIYGYVGLNKGYYIAKDTCGNLFKVKKENIQGFDIEENRITNTANHSVLGKQLVDCIMAKLTYDEKDNEKYSIHTNWVNYEEGKITYDGNMYCGLHFTELDNLYNCFFDQNTLYGYKVVIFKFVPKIYNNVYYNYQENFWLGECLYVERIMSLSEIPTWKYIFENVNNLEEWKNNKQKIIEYTNRLINEDIKDLEEVRNWIELNL